MTQVEIPDEMYSLIKTEIIEGLPELYPNVEEFVREAIRLHPLIIQQ
ncbi:MAG: hypothetical protein WC455_27585 [Dehalococcoidia bacterium]|jgi:Arc/MetJ-type ribon-helix-helix transcriptional regulator